MPALAAIARRHGLRLLEDAAQAHGAEQDGRRAGALADAAAFSFYPTKNLGALGDGGAVVADDPALADELRLRRDYGGVREHALAGTNSRLDELQAALLRVLLGRLDAWNARRRAHARRYLEALGGLPGLEVPRPQEGHVWHVFALLHPARDALAAALAGRGVATGTFYPRPPHLTPAFAHLGLGPGSLPVAERLAARNLALPVGPHLEAGEVERVIAAVRAAV
jgi:dTDP-4-amino-4,6-dideoxygalactose transaminase